MHRSYENLGQPNRYFAINKKHRSAIIDQAYPGEVCCGVVHPPLGILTLGGKLVGTYCSDVLYAHYDLSEYFVLCSQ